MNTCRQVAERREGRLGSDPVSPVVQNFPMTSYPKFLEEHPLITYGKGNQASVPLMMGSTKHDGSFSLGIFYNRFLKDNGNQNNTEFLRDKLVPAILSSLGE